MTESAVYEVHEKTNPVMAAGIPVHCAHDRIVDIVSLVPNPRNPNKHPEHQVQLLARNIQAFGWRAPITVSNRSGFVVRGHCRLLAAQAMGWTHAPVDFQDYATEAEEWADLVADNRIAELSEINTAEMLQLLEDAKTNGTLALTGYEENDLLEMMADLNAENPQEEQFDAESALEDPDAAGIATRCQPGQIWQLGRHRLMCGDSTKAENWDLLLEGKLAQAIITDPPYGVSYIGGRAAQQERIARARRGVEQPSDTYWDDMTPEVYRDLLLKSLTLAHAHSDGKSPLYLWFASAHLRDVLGCISESGWQERNLIVWVKNNGAGALFAQYKHYFEPCLYAFKQGQAPRWHGPTNERTVWEHDKPSKNTLHPTMKPLALIERSINNATEPGDLVVDAFLGSGTAIMAAERTGRICYGFDLEPRYCDVIITRFETETGQIAQLLTT
jgi:DNA modification methylase